MPHPRPEQGTQRAFAEVVFYRLQRHRGHFWLGATPFELIQSSPRKRDNFFVGELRGHPQQRERKQGEGVAGISALGSEGAGFSAEAGFSVVVGAGVRVAGAGVGLGAGEVSFADFRDSNFSFSIFDPIFDDGGFPFRIFIFEFFKALDCRFVFFPPLGVLTPLGKFVPLLNHDVNLEVIVLGRGS